MMRFLITAILMITCTMTHALTITATLPENGYFILNSQSDGNFEKPVSLHTHYEVQGGLNTSVFKLTQNINSNLDLKQYNKVNINAVLEFEAYDKSTDNYKIKITLQPGAFLTYYDGARSGQTKFLKDAQILFATSKQPSITFYGRLNKRNNLKTNDFGTPIIIDKTTNNLFTIIHVVTTKHKTLVLGINKQILIMIKTVS